MEYSGNDCMNFEKLGTGEVISLIIPLECNSPRKIHIDPRAPVVDVVFVELGGRFQREIETPKVNMQVFRHHHNVHCVVDGLPVKIRRLDFRQKANQVCPYNVFRIFFRFCTSRCKGKWDNVNTSCICCGVAAVRIKRVFIEKPSNYAPGAISGKAFCLKAAFSCHQATRPRSDILN